jgi:hypothetical protein
MELRLLEVRDAAPTAPASVAIALRVLCGHVPLHEGVLRRGYRYYPMPGADVPSFLLKRLSVAGQPAAAITLLGALDPRTGEAVLEDCGIPSAVGAAIGSVAGCICASRLSVGARSLTLSEFTSTFWQQDSGLFMIIASEFLALAPLRQDDCELCRHEN